MLVWIFYWIGLERRLLASVRWTLTTAVAFSQKGESNRRSQGDQLRLISFLYSEMEIFDG